MGRRSISSTKAGKFMNPTDQARKEARRKELKKNKKQRLEVRKAVIKQKDPRLIFSEMEAIDKVEYDTNNPPPYNVKVLQEKRRKLKESWLKIYQFYQREDPKMAGELKGLEVEYERKRHQLATIHESIVQAQKVRLDDIPLPSANMLPPPPPPDETTSSYDVSGVISGSSTVTPKSILKFKEATKQKINKEPPGPPSGPPPSLSEFECDNDEFELGLTVNEAYKSNEKPKKIRFDSTETETKTNITKHLGVAIPPPPNVYNQSMISRTVQPPPPPPPPPMTSSQTAQYQQISKSIQQQITNSRIVPQSQQAYYQQQSSHQRQSDPTIQSTTSATIFQAKPVLRNKMAEITRFVPTSLQVKRTDTKKQTNLGISQQQSITSQNFIGQTQQQGPFNYMLQQQQQYATLNPLNTYKSSLSASSNYSSALIPTQVQAAAKSINVTAAPKIHSNAPTATRIDPKDATYESFMKEIGKLL